MKLEDAKKGIEIARHIQSVKSDLLAAIEEDAAVSVTILTDGAGGTWGRKVSIRPDVEKAVLADVAASSRSKLAELTSELNEL